MSEEQLSGAAMLTVRLANDGRPIGAPIDLAETPLSAGPTPAGIARISAGGRIEGLAPKPQQSEGDALLRLVRPGQPPRKLLLRRYQAAAPLPETPFLAPFSVALDPLPESAGEEVVQLSDYRGRELPGSPLTMPPPAAMASALSVQVVAFGVVEQSLEAYESAADWSLVQCPPADAEGRVEIGTLREALAVHGEAEDVVLFLGAGLLPAADALDKICALLGRDEVLAGVDTILEPSGGMAVKIGVPPAFLACRRARLQLPDPVGPIGLEDLFTAIRAQPEIGPFLTLPGLCIRLGE